MRSSTRLAVLGLAILALGAGVGACSPTVVAGPPGHVLRHVNRVVDGDTFVLSGRQKIRLAGVNAPEIDEELGLAAREFSIGFAGRKDAWVTEARKDGYGRLVSDVIVDGKSLAVALVEAGLGHVFLFPPENEVGARALLEAQDRARTARRGIWATTRFQGEFHITSFHANPVGDERENPNSEYVRIGNLRTAPMSLAGYILSNDHGDRYVFGNVTLPPCQTLTLSSGAGDDQAVAGQPVKLFWNQSNPMWSNQGDTATLMDPTGKVVDSVTYDPKHRKVYPK